ncbi:TolC family protein [Flagellimonas sp.]|uniref:TolC family protein n=1 Tax=Flagellimonas sp. TaxID=2058762 RepID=UPI003BB01E90
MNTKTDTFSEGYPRLGILKYLFLSICFSLLLPSVMAQDLSLSDAHGLLLENNGRFKSAVFNTEKTSEEKKAQQGLHYPSLVISGTYLHLQDDISVDLTPQRDLVAGFLQIDDPEALGDWQRLLQGQDFAFASAELSWPLFTGGRINAANEAASLRHDMAHDQQDLQENGLTIQLIETYYGAKLTYELVELRQEVLSSVQRHKERADKFFANGIIAEVETLNAEVALSNAQRELKAAQKDYSLTETALKKLIGFEQFDNLSSLFKSPETVTALEQYQEKMLQNNIQLQLLHKTEELTKTGIKAEKSAYLPSLAVVGNYRFFNENLALGQVNWYVGLGMEWNIFNGFQREHKIKAAELNQLKADATKIQVEKDLLTYTERLYSTMEKQFDLFIGLEKEEQLAERLKFMRERAFQQGLGTSLEVIDATMRLSQIQFLKLQALYEFSKTKGELMVHIGETEDYIQQ